MWPSEMMMYKLRGGASTASVDVYWEFQKNDKTFQMYTREEIEMLELAYFRWMYAQLDALGGYELPDNWESNTFLKTSDLKIPANTVDYIDLSSKGRVFFVWNDDEEYPSEHYQKRNKVVRRVRRRIVTQPIKRSDSVPDWWSRLHAKIRSAKTYCYLRSRSNEPSIIDAFCDTNVYKNRNPTLDPKMISFEENKYNGSEYNYFSSPSGNMLLVPPLDIGATDIKDFAERHGIDEWNVLYQEIMKRWKSGIWVDTEGHAVKYLHVRFEKKPLYKPLPDHTRL